MKAILRASEIQQDKVDDATTVLNVGDEVEAKIVMWIAKLAVSTLSVRAKDEAEQRDAIKALSSNAAADTQPKPLVT